LRVASILLYDYIRRALLRFHFDNFTMKILLLGSTGRLGRCLLAEALRKNYDMNALVRSRSAVVHPSARITWYEGLPTDRAALSAASRGCEAIVSALNISRNSDFPWAALRTPPAFLSEAMVNLIAVSQEHHIRRIIICSAWGVNETKKDLPFWFRWLIDHSNIGVTYRDHERQEDLLKQSTLEWTIVRPVGLTNGTKEHDVRISINNVPKPSLTITRRDVARFMIRALREKLYIREDPVISQK